MKTFRVYFSDAQGDEYTYYGYYESVESASQSCKKAYPFAKILWVELVEE